MQTGFEVTAATPKRLRAADDAPAHETMRGDRKITQAPSTDQKKVRRQMQRKTAAFVPHEHPETEEWHGSQRECAGTMCTSEHNPENNVPRAPEHIADALRSRFESHDEVHIHPSKPNTYVVDPHNTWDGPTHVTHHGDGDFSFDGYQGHSHFGPNAYEKGNCPSCGKGATRKTANFDDPEDIRAVASMSLDAFLASIGDDLTEIEVEAGIRDWWRARNTAFEPLKDSGLPGHEVNHAPLDTASPGPTCNSCQGQGTGFHGETCNRCAGSGKANTRNPNFAIPADGPVRAPSAEPTKTVLPASSFGRSAALNDVGDCRLCEGPLIPKSRDGGTVKAECGDCGTEHSLQASTVEKASARIEMFSNLSERDQARLHALAHSETAMSDPCPNCGDKTWGMRDIEGHADGGTEGFRSMMRCRACDHRYMYHRDRSKANGPAHGRGAASHFATVLSLVGSTWEPITDVSPYLGHTGMSAIARRAQSVLDTEEIL